MQLSFSSREHEHEHVQRAIAGRLPLSLLMSLSLSEGFSWPRWSRSWVAGLSEEARDTQGAASIAGHKICRSSRTGSTNELCGSVVLTFPLVTSVVLTLASSCRVCNKTHPTKYACRAYLFTLRFNFATVDDRDAWFKKFKILAEYVAENEPTTLAYEAATSEDDPLEVLVYER